MYIPFNPNPAGKYVGDCVIRAIVKATNRNWGKVYQDVVNKGYRMKDMPSSNHVWASYLKDSGFRRYIIPDMCPDCYTVKDFCYDHPIGTYILGTGTHVICVVDGDYFDTWDSGDEVPIYYFERS